MVITREFGISTARTTGRVRRRRSPGTPRRRQFLRETVRDIRFGRTPLAPAVIVSVKCFESDIVDRSLGYNRQSPAARLHPANPVRLSGNPIRPSRYHSLAPPGRLWPTRLSAGTPRCPVPKEEYIASTENVTGGGGRRYTVSRCRAAVPKSGTVSREDHRYYHYHYYRNSNS